MTHSATRPTGLTANGVDLTRTDLKISFRIVSGGPEDVWETRGEDTVIPTSHGQFPRNRKRDHLVITAEGFVQGAGADEAAQRADFLATRLAIKALMEPTQAPYTLVHTDETGGEWTISARPENVAWETDDTLPSKREGSCQWRAVEDDWQAGGS